MSVQSELLAVPFPEMVMRLGAGIAQAQYQLDLTSVRIAQLMAGHDGGAKSTDGTPVANRSLITFGDGKKYSLMELGFTPTFYQFVDTVIELKISISMSTQTEDQSQENRIDASGTYWNTGVWTAGELKASVVGASFSAKYQYSTEGSSMLRTKLVPIPPPALFEEKITSLLAQKRAEDTS